MLSSLNEAQSQAVAHPGGPALVLAGAGSGKTRVIVERLAWLVDERGVDPRSLLALTFTNRAAAEMRERVAERLELDRLASWVGTFHSFGLFVLRRDIDKLGRSSNLTVFDDSDQLSLMKRLIKELPRAFAQVSPREALSWISRLKQDLHEPKPDEPPETKEEVTYRELWIRYHAALEQASAVDFDDLLVLLVRLFSEHEDVRQRYARRYAYVHIDEYQDTNRAQYLIAKLLCQDHGNLFVVGDEDQSIYSWRGANIGNILNFERDFPEAKTYRLEQNYRSTAPILKAANAVIAHNESRLGKTLWTEVKTGDPVRVYEAQDGDDEARFVVQDIIESGVAPKDVAILFRTNGQARLIEEALRRKSMAYVVLGGVAFYSRKEVKDLLCYLRLVANPNDDEAFRRVINVPTRGIGAQTMQQIEEYAATRNMPLLQVLRETQEDQTFTARAREAAGGFVHLIDDLALEAKRGEVAGLLATLMDRTDYQGYVKKADEKDFRDRLEIVNEFQSACANFDKQEAGGLPVFLQNLALMSDTDDLNPATPAIKLLTCHSAKGLEFAHVFLVGLEEGFLPHASAMDSDREVEEERRLCYVAMTRARKRLTLSAARSRMVYGQHMDREFSRFLREMPASGIEVIGAERHRKRRAAAKPKAEAKTETAGIKMGTRVRHARFGVGTVMYTKSSGPKMRARIRFETGRTREFVVGMAPLEILERKKR